ncbi:Mitochondrial ribosomal protein l50 [Fasciola gigantica]|uniref:Large ribosomal subunit protein mL50 n=1 Tax=Fasciola gigantica TaxID=46835 RepID=A0A504Z536_FASGI|nr:Mitochondrial ribosomal protein l50 [Fasciola gigantica]
MKDSAFLSRLQSLNDLSQQNLVLKVKPYRPPPDVESRIKELAINLLKANSENPSSYCFKSNEERYKIFTACANEFNHSVLNSYLHELRDVESLIKYYLTPVASPDALYHLLDEAENGNQLPPNLCIQTEPLRFDPNDQTFFKTTAFPGRSTIISGLSTAKKYKGFRAPPSRRIRIEYEDQT